MTKIKTIYKIAESMTELDHIDLALEVMHLKTEGIWPKHAPQYNGFRTSLMLEGYPSDQLMTMVINYIQEYALHRLAVS